MRMLKDLFAGINSQAWHSNISLWLPNHFSITMILRGKQTDFGNMILPKQKKIFPVSSKFGFYLMNLQENVEKRIF